MFTAGTQSTATLEGAPTGVAARLTFQVQQPASLGGAAIVAATATGITEGPAGEYSITYTEPSLAGTYVRVWTYTPLTGPVVVSTETYEVDPPPTASVIGGTETPWTFVNHLAYTDHGKPPAVLAGPSDHGLLLTPEITINVATFALAEVLAYTEILSQGAWWNVAVVDNGRTVYDDSNQPLGNAGDSSQTGMEYWALTGGWMRAGLTPDAVGAYPVGRGAHTGEAMALSVGTTSQGNLIALPAGTHQLALGVPSDMAGNLAAINATAPPAPNVITRNTIFAVRVFGDATATVVAPAPAPPADTRLIRRGDSYTGASAVTASDSSWPDLTGATVRYRAPMGTRSLEVVAAVTGPHAVSLSFTAGDTYAMAPVLYQGELQATLVDGTKTTLQQLDLDARADG